MNIYLNSKYKKFRITLLILYFSLIKLNAIKINNKKKSELPHEYVEKSIPLNKVIPYFDEVMTIHQDKVLKKVSSGDNICIKSIKNHHSLNPSSEIKYKINSQEFLVETNHDGNIYNYTKKILTNLGFDLCNKILELFIPSNKHICEFHSFYNYFLYINYVKNEKIEKIKEELQKGKFIFIKLPEIFNLNLSVANFSENEYNIKSGILENNLIKIDVTDIMLNNICSNYDKEKESDNKKKIYNKSHNVNEEKNIRFAILTSHELSDIIIFSFKIININSIRNYKNMKNIVKLKKDIKNIYMEWEEWSPCYNSCENNFAYKCRYNKCIDDKNSFCDKNFHINFNECESTLCKEPLKDEDNKEIKKEIDFPSNIEKVIYDDEEMLRDNKDKKNVNFFMWLINDKKLSLGLLIFVIGIIILSCIYCYVNSSLNFHNDEEYYVSKYR
ncbi:conserved Plasmodium protein, unknown function [Plasmodium gallinaceum]|uniref:Uncharacterized protein n=1 Tax=Plasmodium gallinaceum TaxID=5849 RepID=A0A1J1GZ66_PLAGA|nr:conserved Plasmodium protein, unknown function [Plasmodium gallinaceum]CRG97749.1 conserved Plasmodium protein, unknown function [Plasmodium gallinaceum]